MVGSALPRHPRPRPQIYKGTVFDLVDHAVDFIQAKLARSVGRRAAGPQAPVEYELPMEAVAEAVVNAIAHRDYASNASVQVLLFSDRLEIWNPGELPPPLTPERLRKPHQSIPRNPLLADPLFLARYIEKAGTGTLDMIARLRAAGLPEQVFEQDGGTFILRLVRPKVPRPMAPETAVGAGSRSESRSEWWRSRPGWRPEWGPESVHAEDEIRARAPPSVSSLRVRLAHLAARPKAEPRPVLPRDGMRGGDGCQGTLGESHGPGRPT